jgi:hypothetical protein
MSYRTDLLAPELTVCLGTDAFLRATGRRLRAYTAFLAVEASGQMRLYEIFADIFELDRRA